MKEPIEIPKAQLILSELIDRVLDGEDIILAEAGVPVAKLVPLPKPGHQKRSGALKG